MTMRQMKISATGRRGFCAGAAAAGLACCARRACCNDSGRRRLGGARAGIGRGRRWRALQVGFGMGDAGVGRRAGAAHFGIIAAVDRLNRGFRRFGLVGFLEPLLVVRQKRLCFA